MCELHTIKLYSQMLVNVFNGHALMCYPHASVGLLAICSVGIAMLFTVLQGSVKFAMILQSAPNSANRNRVLMLVTSPVPASHLRPLRLPSPIQPNL